MKKCRKCKKDKLLGEYYIHSAMKDGHVNVCKDCTRTSVSAHRKLNLEKIQAYDRTRRASENLSEKDKEKRAVIGSRWRRNNRERYNANGRRYRRGKVGRAHNAVNRKLKDEKPSICSLCKKPSDAIQGHHPDYNKPLGVIWCCPACHGKLHRRDSRLAIRETHAVVDVTNES